MANEEHLKILKQGVKVWNRWREDNPEIRPDLECADLRGTSLKTVNFRGATLEYADLEDTDLENANFFDAILAGANLNSANLMTANFEGTNLEDAHLRFANLTGANLWSAKIIYADLEGTDLKNAHLIRTVLNRTILKETNFAGVSMAYATISSTDLGAVKGLDHVDHIGPSTIGIDTLYKSGGNIPPEFLRGCGVPEEIITFSASLIGARDAIQFYSCFISYSTKDEEFARRLHSRMVQEKMRVWFAPEDMRGGELLHEQIERAIRVHDRLLIVLSEESMASEWVKREIRNARRAEKRENRRKLFPIRLVDFDPIAKWKGFEGDGAEDLAFELGKFYIPDFSNWKNDHDAFEREFAKLLRDLRAEERKA